MDDITKTAQQAKAINALDFRCMKPNRQVAPTCVFKLAVFDEMPTFRPAPPFARYGLFSRTMLACAFQSHVSA